MDEKKGKSLYDTGKLEIIGKEFLAGFARGLGGLVVTLISWVIIFFIIVKLLLPQLQGTIDQLNNTLKLIPGTGKTTQSGSSTTGKTVISVPENLLNELQQIQQGNK